MSLPRQRATHTNGPDDGAALDSLSHWRLTVRWPQWGVQAVLAIPVTDKARKAGLDVWHGSTHTVRQPE